jgi:hypothetical protein
MKLKTFAFILSLSVYSTRMLSAEQVDCSEAYDGQVANCERVACSEKYNGFLGVWQGPMETYDLELKRFRSFFNTVTYSEKDCLRNTTSGETFIIGRRLDTYPPVLDENGIELKGAQSKSGLLVTGRDAAGAKILWTVDPSERPGERMIRYAPVFIEEASETAIWKYDYPGSTENPPMTITVMDLRDQTLGPSVHKRLVTVTISINQDSFVVSRGFHTLSK